MSEQALQQVAEQFTEVMGMTPEEFKKQSSEKIEDLRL